MTRIVYLCFGDVFAFLPNMIVVSVAKIFYLNEAQWKSESGYITTKGAILSYSKGFSAENES